MKVIAFYLPQYHRTPENDRWWGRGFTEWTNMQKAVPLFEGHYQPRVPLNDNYYCLTEVGTLAWQVALAKQYGIYGFCMYHYWFSGQKLLDRPLDLWLKNPQIQLPFCLCWANETWTKSWNVNSTDDILILQEYGDQKEWKDHFEYLYPFFVDSRYIKIQGKPLFVLYRPELLKNRRDMILFWDNLAKEKGFPGIAFAAQQRFFNVAKEADGDLFTYQIEYQPALVREKIEALATIDNGVRCIDYDGAWQTVLNFKPLNHKSVPGAFVDWDNTPRKGKQGVVFKGATPIKFKRYFAQQLWRTESVYKQDMIFLFAWNEWSEGGYLEPDDKNQYGYLAAIRDTISNFQLLKKGEMNSV